MEISDDDLDFKQSELKKERNKMTRKQKERERCSRSWRNSSSSSKMPERFAAAFHADPETRETMRANEKNVFRRPTVWPRWKAKSGHMQKNLPFAITGRLFKAMRRQIEVERGSAGSEAIRENVPA